MSNQKKTGYIASDAEIPETDVKAQYRTFDGVRVDELFRIPEKFAVMNRLITTDLNSNRGSSADKVFSLYTKEDINRYLKAPGKHAKELRDAVVYIYGASSHFRRLIQYFTSLSDLSYVVSPYKLDPNTIMPKTVNARYRRVLNDLSSMNIKTQFPKILTVCLREDIFYGTIWDGRDDKTIQQLPSEYCKICCIEGGVLNIAFDFSYFDRNPDNLAFYPPEFTIKYKLYKDKSKKEFGKWQELDSPTSFAVKCNNDILDYPIPPFAGVLREIYDIEQYKQLKLTKTELENYAMIVMTLGIDEEGHWQMDLEKAKDFWSNLDSILPDEIGSILTPMPIDKISFERKNNGETNTIAEAEQNMFTSAGVSSLLFNNEKASANALTLSIKADQAITYGIVKSIEDVVNRYIRSKTYGKNFKVTFLDCSPFNRRELGDQYLKACQFGLPMVSYYCASQGLCQEEMDSMNFLENNVLRLKDVLIPLQSSSTQSGNKDSGEGATDEGGAPRKDIEDLSESGEQDREDA